MLGEPLDTLALAGLFAVELLGVELLVQAQGFDFAVQTGQVGFGGSGEVEPCGPCCFVFRLQSRTVSPGNVISGGWERRTDLLHFFLG